MLNNKKLGIITPSTPAPALFETRYKRALNMLRSMNIEFKEGAFVTSKNGYVSANAQDRAKDIHQMYSDDEIGLIMATIGGNYSAEILPYLDWNLLAKNPKGIIGYSDITILLMAIGVRAKQIVYYGPTLMTEFAEYPTAPHYSMSAFQKVFKTNDKIKISPCNKLYTDGSDWALSPQERRLSCNVFSKTIRSGVTSGVVLGGCIESLERIRGTEYWPNLNNAILLLESSEDNFNELKWRAVITDYNNMHVFENISGLIIGQKKWSVDEVELLSNMLLSITKNKPIPILYGLPFGHISPIATIPMFTTAKLDTDQKSLTFFNPTEYTYVEN